LESYKEAIFVDKDLHAIKVIKDDESTKDSKDVSRKPQAMASKGRDKEATDIETLTHLVKNLTSEVSELKQRKTNTFSSSHLPRQRQEKKLIEQLIKQQPICFKKCTEAYVPTRTMCRS